MKNLYLTFFLVAMLGNLTFSQDYVPFPTGEARWNHLNWHQIIPDEYTLTNYSYFQSGDTVINNQTYHKLYNEPGWITASYIGGVREDSLKNIYFFPKEIYIEYGIGIVWFPSNTQEHLLYSFNDLYTGKTLTINDKEITIGQIDTIVINDQPRRRYSVEGTWNRDEYWIEGIGSDNEFFSAYTYEFEWQNFVTCFTQDDQPTVFVSHPFMHDACEYYVGINDPEPEQINIFPNPASESIRITTDFTGSYQIMIYNSQGRCIFQQPAFSETTVLNISHFKDGIYYIRCTQKGKNLNAAFVKA